MASGNRLQRLVDEVTAQLRAAGYGAVISVGGLHPDKNGWVMSFVGGTAVKEKKYQKVGGATLRQLEQIDASATSDQDAKRRIIATILDGRDPGAPPEERLITQSEMDAHVKRAVNDAVMAALKTIGQQAPKPSFSAKTEVLPKPKEPPKPKAEKPNKRVPPPKQVHIEIADRSMATWIGHAKDAGLPPPKCKQNDPTTVDGRWLNHWAPKWQAWMAQQVSGKDMTVHMPGLPF